MKKKFSAWKKENLNDNQAIQKVHGLSEEEYLKSKSIMDLMERIAELSFEEGSPKQVIQEPEISFWASELGQRLSITPLQALLLSLFINFYPDSEIQTTDIAKHLSSQRRKVEKTLAL